MEDSARLVYQLFLKAIETKAKETNKEKEDPRARSVVIGQVVSRM